MEKLFFESWESLGRTASITIMAYLSLVFLLRVSGKRTLSKMNAFDMVVTIALGSTLATVILTKDVVLADGVLAFFLLIFLQYIITWLSVRSKTVRKLVKSSPVLLMYKGEVFEEVMKKERITTDELYEKVRENGFSALGEVDAVILETAGTLTILGQVHYPGSSTMDAAKRP